MKKGIVLGIVFLFVVMSFTSISSIQIDKNIILSSGRGNILYVGGSGEGNYSKIQDAVDNSSDGDTVFVFSGIYNENIIVNKSINVNGEDKNSTIIKSSSWEAVYIIADYVNFSNFKLQSIEYCGIYLNSNNSIIRDNILDVYEYVYWSIIGIYLGYSNYNIICGNYISVKGYSIEWNSYTFGIYLFRSDNNIITGNNISNNTMYDYSDNGYGIRVSHSKNNTIKDNIISNNNIGVGFYLSYDNNISGNSIFKNSIGGIILERSSKNNILYNYFSHNSESGINLLMSNNTKIFFNWFIDDGIFVYDSYFNNVENNLVNGKPLIYLEDKSDYIITDAGQIILINCSNITAENLNLSYTSVGVELWGSNNCKISGNDCMNTFYGIYIRHSSNIMVEGNNLNSNIGYGVYSYNAHNIIISNNSINGRYYGVSLRESEDNIINDNNISNNGHGIILGGSYFGSYSKNITISGNTICSNRYMDGGIVIVYSKFINITGNIISNNNNGIYAADGASHIVIKDNVISNNSGVSRGHGMLFWGAHNISVISNKINSNHRYGIHLFTGSNYNILNNSLSKNGLVVHKSNNNNVENNSVNGKPLVYFENKSNHIITDAGQVVLIRCNNITVNNLNLTNASIGIQLHRTNYCKITNNNCSYGNIGIYFRESNNNTLITNRIISNDNAGIIFQLTSNNNNISKNIITENKRDGIHITHSNNIIIEGNSISKNDGGIYFYSIRNSKIFHNNFIDNEKNARDGGNNTWDDGYPSGGNYWDDYTGEDNDSDGIGDTPYLIPGGDNEDRYPLMEPYGNNPPDIPTIAGPNIGKPNIEYDFTFNAIDPDGDAIMYVVDWGDNNTEWTEYNDSGVGIILKHTWNETGVYTIKAQAVDFYGAESDWAEFTVTMPRNKASSNILFQGLKYNSQDYNKYYTSEGGI